MFREFGSLAGLGALLRRQTLSTALGGWREEPIGVHKHLQCARTGLPSGEYDEGLALSDIPSLLLHLQATAHIDCFFSSPSTGLATEKWLTWVNMSHKQRCGKWREQHQHKQLVSRAAKWKRKDRITERVGMAFSNNCCVFPLAVGNKQSPFFRDKTCLSLH